ncbi:MAG: DUF2127 domain-containing protein [Sulfuricaulis sp.]
MKNHSGRVDVQKKQAPGATDLSVVPPRDQPHTERGLRTVAMFEATKGVLVLAVGLGLLSLVHHDIQSVGEDIVRRFDLDLAHRYPRILIVAATHLGNTRLRLLALAALLYSMVRFLEAYGLWYRRVWAEWFAVISGGIFLPFELYALIRYATVVKAVVLTVNIGIVAYMIYVLKSEIRRRNRSDPTK